MFSDVEKVADGFWERCEKAGPCWNWSGKKFDDGYGVLLIEGRVRRAHRVAYFLARGVDPGGRHVLHECDNRACVNPGHLYLGDDRQNAKDRQARGRGGNVKLTWEIVREMRRLYAQGVGAREIDQRFGYRGSANIVRNHSWHDPSYTPPPKQGHGGPRQLVLEAFGETRTAAEWSTDPRCEVAYHTLRKRISAGVAGENALRRFSDAGRPRSSH